VKVLRIAKRLAGLEVPIDEPAGDLVADAEGGEVRRLRGLEVAAADAEEEAIGDGVGRGAADVEAPIDRGRLLSMKPPFTAAAPASLLVTESTTAPPKT
jgi:hypothetical protein